MTCKTRPVANNRKSKSYESERCKRLEKNFRFRLEKSMTCFMHHRSVVNGQPLFTFLYKGKKLIFYLILILFLCKHGIHIWFLRK